MVICQIEFFHVLLQNLLRVVLQLNFFCPAHQVLLDKLILLLYLPDSRLVLFLHREHPFLQVLNLVFFFVEFYGHFGD